MVSGKLKGKEIKVGRSKVQRVMPENGIRAQIKSKYKPQTTKSNPDDAVFENLLQQDFSTTEFNKVWLADITYIRTGGKWSYLAAVIEPYPQKADRLGIWQQADS